MDGFGIPFLDGGWYGIHGHDSSHEGGGIPAEKYPIRTFRSFILAWATWFWNSETLVQEGGISSVLLKDHLFGCEPDDGCSSDISLFKVFIELGDKVYVGS